MTQPFKFIPVDTGYERPNFPWRCGAGAQWTRPCTLGPSIHGQCRGTSECAPTRKGDRWECRRPASLGGPCPVGPGTDGSCSQRHPPCAPVRTIRGWRGHLTVLAIVLMLSLIAALHSESFTRASGVSSINPGPLTSRHAQFVGEQGCATCHAAHGQGPGGWLAAAFAPRDPSGRCVDCHAFGGSAEAAHNTMFEKRQDVAQTSCIMCHTEHKGATANLVQIADAQCQTCHTKKFDHFAKNHPQFGPRYPYPERGAIQFNHVAHFEKHFADPRYKPNAPTGCVGCHRLDAGVNVMRTTKFADMCATCHADQITRREFVLFRLPEFNESKIAAAKVTEACGPSPAELESLKARLNALTRGTPPPQAKNEPYSSVSADPPNAVLAYLLGVPADDPDVYGEPVQSLVLDMARDGVMPLADKLPASASRPALLAGLNGELVRRVACAWAANREYEPPPEGKGTTGWKADGLTLRLVPAGHADPVVRSWLDFVVSGPPAKSKEDAARLDAMRKEMLSTSEGPGACVKCHALTTASGDKLQIDWSKHYARSGPQTHFLHAPHVNLLGPDATCTVCHKFDSTADYAAAFKTLDPHQYVSNFKAMVTTTCSECHAAGKVRADCQACHTYHRDHTFKKRMVNIDSAAAN